MTIVHGDCLDVLPGYVNGAFDAIITDPPYHLTQASRRGSPRQNDPSTPFGRTRLGSAGFMGKTWDGGDIAFRMELWAECLRVVKPGAYLLAFGGTRTYHRMACAIEDAGWEIHDCIMWIYGSGFPKHASKLKPAVEPIVLARRPAKRATPLNIDACRIGEDVLTNHGGGRNDMPRIYGGGSGIPSVAAGSNPRVGRWPANVVLDEDAAAMLDEASGERPGAASNSRGDTGTFDFGTHAKRDGYADIGGASRFFYVAKASRSERELGLDALPARVLGTLAGGGEGASDPVSLRFTKKARNTHPTVKPLALMRWLVRLVTPAGGMVLDPFAGSGSTGCAAAMEGFEFTGIEREAEYVEIARRRIAHAAAQQVLPLTTDGAA